MYAIQVRTEHESDLSTVSWNRLTVLMPYSNLIEEILSAMHYASTYIKGMMHWVFPNIHGTILGLVFTCLQVTDCSSLISTSIPTLKSEVSHEES